MKNEPVPDLAAESVRWRRALPWGVWLVVVVFGRALPEVVTGALILSLPAWRLWRWSGA